jgi:hypothetical protein
MFRRCISHPSSGRRVNETVLLEARPVCYFLCFLTMKMETIRFSETSELFRTLRRFVCVDCEPHIWNLDHYQNDQFSDIKKFIRNAVSI